MGKGLRTLIWVIIIVIIVWFIYSLSTPATEVTFEPADEDVVTEETMDDTPEIVEEVEE